VKESWRIENFGVKVPTQVVMSDKESRALKILDATTKYVNGRWESGLLWKRDDVKFPESYSTAFHRLKTMERKMDKDPEFADQYCQKIKDYVKKSYAKKVDPKEDIDGLRIWYLPHFAVKNDNKPGKIRFVFDAAAESNGTSLNDNLLTGPDLLNPLTSILYKFRQRRVAFGADIKEMFHQVMIRSEDRSAQRFLWRGKDRDREPDIFEMQAMTFGASSSPCTAHYVKNKNAITFSKDPEIIDAIVKRHYVDDYLDSCNDPDQSLDRILKVIKVSAQGGFEIRGWTCSSKGVLSRIPQNLRATTDEEIIWTGDLPVERVLGLRWNPNTDTFGFHVKKEKTDFKGESAVTKRQVLKLVMSLFDPLGFLSNYIVQAKILLQDVWRTEIGWDDELAGENLLKWTHWFGELKQIEKIQIPRCYSNMTADNPNIQLHVFCDASEQAFAAVAYLRITKRMKTEVAFVCGKTRVAPLRPTSIPRLELQAAVIRAG